MDKSKLEGRIAHLEQQHAAIDKQINQGHSHYVSDIGLNKAKQEKLSIKRRIIAAKEKLTTL